MLTQIKFTVDSALANRFKEVVVRRRGKLDLSREGAEALRLYLERVNTEMREPAKEPVLKVLGIATSRGKARPNALADKRRLYEE
jgi:hypothetical protein